MPGGGRGLILRVLDAFRPRGATWSGQLISSRRVLVGGPPRRTSCLVTESPRFTGLGAPSLPGFPVSPLPSLYRASLRQVAGARCLFSVGAGGAGVGARHLPHSALSCQLTLHAAGAAQGLPEGGAPRFPEDGPELDTLPPPTPRPWGRPPGPAARKPSGACSVGMGTGHLPHSACSCELALHAVGAAHGRLERGASFLCDGPPGSDTVTPPTPRPWGRRPGPAACLPWAPGLRAWEPVRDPTPHALASWLCAPWQQPSGAQRGRLVPL